MKTSDFNYQLPVDHIAQTPVEPRDHSRLLVLDRSTGSLIHCHFFDLLDYLKKGDVLVINESRVIPARFFGLKVGGQVQVEVFLLNRVEPDVWETLLNPGRRLKPGSRIEISSVDGKDCMVAEVLSKTESGTAMVRFDRSDLLEKLGEVPLPPYIHTKVDDPERYQTVYSQTKGSVAAPTAGLHFTPSLMQKIREKGVEFVTVTLHVGLGTFRPVKVDDPREHALHSEYFEVTSEAADKINRAKAEGGRIIAVGTTSVRSLERVISPSGQVKPLSGWNDLYILPGYEFRAVDAVVTNFHLPQSTLLMLVSAFAGREKVLNAYEEAVRADYRFFSFGDAMLII